MRKREVDEYGDQNFLGGFGDEGKKIRGRIQISLGTLKSRKED